MYRTVIAFAASALLVACIGPTDRRPGLWLSGDVARQTPTDWSFANEEREIAIQVATPYLLPHSVTIWCASDGAHLFLGARNPDEKNWPGWVARDPEVRLKIGARLYDVKLAVVEKPDEIEAVRRAYARKYDLPARPSGEALPMRYWRVEPRT